MTEIRIDVDLEHPPQRVWRALTDERLLPQWFADTKLEPRAGSRFRLRPEDLPGLDGPVEGEVIGIDEPRRISMQWHEDALQTRVIWELTPTDEGCRLALRQVRVLGEWDPARRDQLEQTYQQMLDGRLPAVLDWLAFHELDLGTQAEAGESAEPEPQPAASSASRPRRGRLVAAAAAGVVAVLSAVAMVSLVRTPADKAATGAPGPTSSDAAEISPFPTDPAPTAPARAERVGATLSPAATRATRRPAGTSTPVRSPLNARYAMVTSRVFGYQAEITINNPGDAAAPDWVVTITLPKGATVSSASGASYQQKGTTVTFTGSAVAPRRSTRFQFDVASNASIHQKQPTSCDVNGQACAGL